MEGKADAGFSVPRSDPGSYLLTEWRAVVTYLRLLLWPAGQSADWSFPLSRSLSEPAVLLSGLLLAALLALPASAQTFRATPVQAPGVSGVPAVPAALMVWQDGETIVGNADLLRLRHSTNHAVNPSPTRPEPATSISISAPPPVWKRTSCPIRLRIEPIEKTASEFRPI